MPPHRSAIADQRRRPHHLNRLSLAGATPRATTAAALGGHPGGHQGGQPFQQRSDGPRRDNRPRHNDGQRQQPETPRGAVWLYGHHAVAAALANPQRRLRRLALTEEAEAALAQIVPPPWPLQPERTDRGRIDQLLGRDLRPSGARRLLADPLAQPSTRDGYWERSRARSWCWTR